MEELNYKKAYLNLFNEVSEIIEKLQLAQIEAENICVDIDDETNDEIE